MMDFQACPDHNDLAHVADHGGVLAGEELARLLAGQARPLQELLAAHTHGDGLLQLVERRVSREDHAQLCALDQVAHDNLRLRRHAQQRTTCGEGGRHWAGKRAVRRAAPLRRPEALPPQPWMAEILLRPLPTPSPPHRVARRLRPGLQPRCRRAPRYQALGRGAPLQACGTTRPRRSRVSCSPRHAADPGRLHLPSSRGSKICHPRAGSSAPCSHPADGRRGSPTHPRGSAPRR
mmetsp:Transcript_64760/g.189928  ORF Transcript_64760/g.189928 Transcript_64760/m.189928 type:complete len:235 (-) Transcript_64760:142-846(-)